MNTNVVEAPEQNIAQTAEQALPTVTPRLAVSESDGTLQVSLALPGVSKENLKLNREGDLISIEAQSGKSREHGTAIYSEYSDTVRFSQQFKIAETVDAESISATLKEGVLDVRFQLKPEFVPKSITVH